MKRNYERLVAGAAPGPSSSRSASTSSAAACTSPASCSCAPPRARWRRSSRPSFLRSSRISRADPGRARDHRRAARVHRARGDRRRRVVDTAADPRRAPRGRCPARSIPGDGRLDRHGLSPRRCRGDGFRNPRARRRATCARRSAPNRRPSEGTRRRDDHLAAVLDRSGGGPARQLERAHARRRAPEVVPQRDHRRRRLDERTQGVLPAPAGPLKVFCQHLQVLPPASVRAGASDRDRTTVDLGFTSNDVFVDVDLPLYRTSPAGGGRRAGCRR